MRQSRYETGLLPRLGELAGLLAAGEELDGAARRLGLRPGTLRRYLTLARRGDDRYAALRRAVDGAPAGPDAEVEAALYRRCTGYSAPVIKHYKLKRVDYDPDTGKRVRETEELVEAREEIHVAANTSAHMDWLTNPRPDRWQFRPVRATDGEEESGEPGVLILPGPEEEPG